MEISRVWTEYKESLSREDIDRISRSLRLRDDMSFTDTARSHVPFRTPNEVDWDGSRPSSQASALVGTRFLGEITLDTGSLSRHTKVPRLLLKDSRLDFLPTDENIAQGLYILNISDNHITKL